MGFPAEYMFKGVPHYDRVDDPLDMLVALMDHFGITKAPTGIGSQGGADQCDAGVTPVGSSRRARSTRTKAWRPCVRSTAR